MSRGSWMCPPLRCILQSSWKVITPALAGAQQRKAALEHALAVLCGALPSELAPAVNTNVVYLPAVAPDLPSALSVFNRNGECSVVFLPRAFNLVL